MKQPLKGKPFTAAAVITASGVTALFIAVWAVTGTVNLASSIITLGAWWLGATVAATVEYIAQEEKNTDERR